jgi:hypothetical protein
VIIHRPPAPWVAEGAFTVFLAGSIEMGAAPNWQQRLADALPAGTVALDPRRTEWDASWRQSIDEPKFRAQVDWELDGLERADLIAMWFEPATKSPVTLLELGLHARGGKLVVGCPDGFWRRGNIEVVCARYGAALHADWDRFVAAVVARCST